MSAQAKLFITLCKQTVSWTGCRRGGRVVCEVREGCQRRSSLTPITLPLISPPRLCPHYSSDTGTRPWWLYTELHVELLKSPHVFISEFYDIFPPDFPFSFPFEALVSAPLIKPGAEALSGICKFMCLCLVFVCLWVACGEERGWATVASGLWEADWSASLTHCIA